MSSTPSRSPPGINLVSEYNIGKYRAWMKLKAAAVAVVDGNAEDIGRQQVAGELDALKFQAQRRCNGVGQRGFADPWHILDQQMATGQQAGDGQPDLLRFAENDAVDLFGNRIDL